MTAPQGSPRRRRQTKPPTAEDERIAHENGASREVGSDEGAASGAAEVGDGINGVDEIAATIWSRIDQLLLKAMC